MSTIPVYWKRVPPKSLIAFLLGVFLLFRIIGFASDIPEMGRRPRLRFVLNVLIAGIFPVFYAFAGFMLRKQWWKAVLPIFAVHFALLSVLAHALPDAPQPPLSVVNRQLAIDAIAIMAAVSLGYGCFLTCRSPNFEDISGCTQRWNWRVRFTACWCRRSIRAWAALSFTDGARRAGRWAAT